MNYILLRERLITYGLFNGELKHISKVSNGLSCNCVCANCHESLVAKNNPLNKKASHFAHHSGGECIGAYETALHLLAKKILAETKTLLTPSYHYDYNPGNPKSLFKKSKEIIFDEVTLEKNVHINGDRFVPDAIGKINTNLLFIEFANTHFIGDPKKNKIHESGIACIEIDLSNQVLEEDSLKEFLLSDNQNKYWIINPKLDKEYTEFKSKKDLEALQNKIKYAAERELKESNKEIENEIKVQKYKDSKYFNNFKTDEWGYVSACPLKQIRLQEFKSTQYYKHPILSKIIDGVFWNNTIYGNPPHGKYIFLNNEKITIYPPDHISVTQMESRNNRFFHKGLCEISSAMSNAKFGDCKSCQYLWDTYYKGGDEYIVCKKKIS